MHSARTLQLALQTVQYPYTRNPRSCRTPGRNPISSGYCVWKPRHARRVRRRLPLADKPAIRSTRHSGRLPLPCPTPDHQVRISEHQNLASRGLVPSLGLQLRMSWSPKGLGGWLLTSRHPISATRVLLRSAISIRELLGSSNEHHKIHACNCCLISLRPKSCFSTPVQERKRVSTS